MLGIRWATVVGYEERSGTSLARFAEIKDTGE